MLDYVQTCSKILVFCWDPEPEDSAKRKPRCSTQFPTKDPEFLDDEPHEPMSIQTRMAAERATLGKNGKTHHEAMNDG